MENNRRKGEGTKSKKDKFHIRNKMDYYIGNYVYDKEDVKKARKYASGSRDAAAFAFLEKNYGVGTPSSIKFSPLINLRRNILKGLLISQEVKSQVIAVDKETVEKESGELQDKNKKEATEAIDAGIQAGNNKHAIASALNSVKEKYDAEFVSTYQAAGQHIVDNFLYSHDYNIVGKQEEIFDELSIANEFVIKEEPIRNGKSPEVTICRSEDVFFMKDRNSNDINTSDGIVHRYYKTKRQVIMELGGYMTKTEKEEFLKDESIGIGVDSNSRFLRDYSVNRFSDSNLPDDLFDAYYNRLNEVVEVYHVQYKETEEVKREPNTFSEKMSVLLGNKNSKKYKDDIEVLYEGWRVGFELYLGVGKKKNPNRDYRDYRRVFFDYKGMSFNEYRGKLQSIVYNMIDLQDMTDILIFHRENMIALSGNKGSRVNLAAIPTIFGKKFMDRIKLFEALKKNGNEYYDMTQEGAAAFQQSGDYDNSLNGQAVAAVTSVIETFAKDADAVCGINANMRGQIEQREAVNNVQTGVMMISYATKKFFRDIDRGLEMMLFSLLNGVRKSYTDGYSGVYYIGKNRNTFNLSPEKYSVSTFILNIRRDDSDTIALEKLKNIVSEMASKGIIDPKNSILSVVTTSKQELQDLAIEGIEKQSKKNDKLKQMGQQMEQMDNKIKEQTKENEKLKKVIQNFEKKNLELETEKVKIDKIKAESDANYNKKKLVQDKEFNDGKLTEISRRSDLEEKQIYLDGKSKEVENMRI